QGHHYRLICLFELGRMPEVYAELRAKARLVEELRQPAQHWYLAVIEAELKLFEGRFLEAEDAILRALQFGQKALHNDAVVSFRMQMFVLRKLRGGLEEIEPILQRSRNEYPMYPMFRCMLANLYAELGRAADARRVLEEVAANNFRDLPMDCEW